MPTPTAFAFCNFLSFTIASMSANSELQKLVREFEHEGMPHLFSHPPTSTTHEETPLTPTQPMQTRSTRKKFKPEVCSKRNEDRHQQSRKTPEDPKMNLSGSAEVPFEEDEKIAPQHPPYLLPSSTRSSAPSVEEEVHITYPFTATGCAAGRDNDREDRPAQVH